MSERMFPVHSSGRNAKPHPTRIPWSIADKAYSVYSARHGRQQSLERLAERGGFHPDEMDEFYPAWREETSEIAALRTQLAAVERWVDDLQSGLFINCVYCGFRYGPRDTHVESLDDPKATASMRDALTAHVQRCSKHPLATVEQRVVTLEKVLAGVAWTSTTGLCWCRNGDDCADEPQCIDAYAALRPPPGGK